MYFCEPLNINKNNWLVNTNKHLSANCARQHLASSGWVPRIQCWTTRTLILSPIHEHSTQYRKCRINKNLTMRIYFKIYIWLLFKSLCAQILPGSFKFQLQVDVKLTRTVRFDIQSYQSWFSTQYGLWKFSTPVATRETSWTVVGSQSLKFWQLHFLYAILKFW